MIWRVLVIRRCCRIIPWHWAFLLPSAKSEGITSRCIASESIPANGNSSSVERRQIWEILREEETMLDRNYIFQIDTRSWGIMDLENFEGSLPWFDVRIDAQAESVRSALLNAAKSWNVRDLYFPYQEDEGASFQSLNSPIQVPKDSSSILHLWWNRVQRHSPAQAHPLPVHYLCLISYESAPGSRHMKSQEHFIGVWAKHDQRLAATSCSSTGLPLPPLLTSGPESKIGWPSILQLRISSTLPLLSSSTRSRSSSRKQY